MKFTELNISDSLKEALHYMGFEQTTPIQEQAIPAILDGSDLIGCAQTGTGKTAAFLIPLLEKLSKDHPQNIRALIIVPTRELALQIDEQVQALSYFTSISSITVFGGGDSSLFSVQKNAIEQGADIIIATPGRLIAHMNMGYVDLSKIEMLILDEADRMLDMGFIDDITRIIKTCNINRQTLMFSATMAPEIRKLASGILSQPVQINLAIAKPAEGVVQQVYLVHDDNKIALLEHILSTSTVTNMIVFASKKEIVDAIERSIRKCGHPVKSLHSGREQSERQERLREFKAGKIKILVATDVLSRGIDIDGLSHVVNYDIPAEAADYVHRVGRTARADKEGTAISFVNSKDIQKLRRIERLIERQFTLLPTPTHIGESPDPDAPKALQNRDNRNGNRFPFKKRNNQRHPGQRKRE
jgi:superfamily II DNA/RNA helicase